MTDSTLEVQKAVVAVLKGDGAVSALVGDRVWDEPPHEESAEFAFPFIEIGDANGDAWDADGMVGWDLALAIRCWSRAPGRAETRQIMAAVKAALHQASLTLDTQTFIWGEIADQRDMREGDGRTSGGFQRFRFVTHEP